MILSITSCSLLLALGPRLRCSTGDLASAHIKLTLELFWWAQFQYSHKEPMSGVAWRCFRCQWVQHEPSSPCSDARMRGLQQWIRTVSRSMLSASSSLQVFGHFGVFSLMSNMSALYRAGVACLIYINIENLIKCQCLILQASLWDCLIILTKWLFNSFTATLFRYYFTSLVNPNQALQLYIQFRMPGPWLMKLINFSNCRPTVYMHFIQRHKVEKYKIK